MIEDEPDDGKEAALRRRVQGEGGAGGAEGDLTVAELVAKHGVPQTLINTWKRQSEEGMSTVFSGTAEAAAADREAELGRLRAKIGELVVERVFLRKASGR